MATIQDAYKAFEAAEAAGDKEAASQIAGAIHQMQMESRKDKPLEDPIASVVGLPATSAGEPGMFQMRDRQSTSLGELGGATAGGAAAGAAMGAVLPKALEMGAKLPVIPAPIRGVMAASGAALGAIPAKERIARGAGGGAAMGLTEEGGRAMGLPTAVTGAAALGTGVVGEATGSLLLKESTQLLSAAANLAHGNMAGVFYALRGMVTPNKEVNVAAAKKIQEKLFGAKLPDYVDKLQSSENRMALQAELRKQDPTLVQQRGAPFRQDQPKTSDSTELAPLGGEVGFPGWQRGKPTTDWKDAAQRIKDRQTAVANRDPVAEQNLKPASEIYRERLFNGVNKAVEQGNAFSMTPEFQGLLNKLKVPTAYGDVSRVEINKLIKTLSQDRSSDPAIRRVYAEKVDNVIREWGKPQEKGGQTGAAAIPAKTAQEVRDAVREAYNQYTSRIGMGEMEKKYRDTYSKEMIAEAKDKLPQVLSGVGAPEKLADLARNLSKDPAGKQFIQQTLRTHLAQQEPTAVLKEFERTQKALVAANVIDLAGLKQMRMATEAVDRMATQGAKLKAMERAKQVLLMSMAQTMGAMGGSAVARPEQ